MTRPDRLWDIGRLVLNVLVFALAVWALTEALTFRPLAAYFPGTAAGMIALLVGIQMVMDVRNLLTGRPVLVRGMDVDSAVHDMGRSGLLIALRYIAWFLLFVALLSLTGPLVSSGLFVGAFVRLEGRWTWRGVVAAAVVLVAAVAIVIGGLGLDAPPAVWEIGYELL